MKDKSFTYLRKGMVIFMKQKIQSILFIVFAMLMLLPCGVASASPSTVFDLEGRTDTNDDYSYSQTKDGYTLQLQSSVTTDKICLYYAGNYPYSNMSGDCVQICSSGYESPKGTITVSAVGGKVFSLNSFLCATDYSANISITTVETTETFQTIAINGSYGGTITPSEAFRGITSFTLSWDNGNPMTFDNFDISFAPVITSNPSNSSIQTDENASFSVAAIGNGSLTYQWQVETSGSSGFANLPEGGAYSGVTTPTLSIKGATKGMNQYRYHCVVTDGNSLFSFSNNAVLTVISRAPTDIALDASIVDENTVTGTKVGNLSSVDMDSSSFTYSLVDTATYPDNASFSILGSDLRLNMVPDYETKSSYSICVRTTDDDNLTYDKTFTITVTDQNDAPTDIVLSPSGIPENSSLGTVIGTLSGADQDTLDSLSYELVTGEGDTDNSKFSLSGNELKLNFVPDYETKSTYSVRVRVSDGTLGYEKSLTITITNVNEEPDGLVLANASVMENSSVGTPIGILTGSDPDSGSVLTYSLTAGTGDVDNGCFSVAGNTLLLRVVPDFETRSSYSIRVGVSDGQYTYSKEFTITILDGNDPPTDITLTGGTIPENSASGTSAGSLGASDPNSGDVISYTLTAGTGDDDNASFTISGNELKLKLSPDYETKSSYQVRIRATDNCGLYLDKVFVIAISNENEPPTELTLSKTAIAENEPVGSVIGSFITTDPDTDSVFTYSFVAGEGDGDNGSFLIDADKLKVKFIPDYETKNSYSIRVRVSDGSSFLEKQFTITIQDGNDAPTDIGITKSSVNEKVDAGTTVATLLATDSNTGDTFNYTLANGTGDADNSSFQISGDNLLITEIPDFETKSSYKIRIRTTDQGGMYYEKAFIITVNDVNEAPMNLTLENSSVDENSPTGTIIGTLSGTDQDAGNTLTYSLVAGAGATDNAFFVIDENKLKTAAEFNYETKTSYSIRVRVTDQGSLWYEKIITIAVNDINEVPTEISLSNSVIAENTAAGTKIGTISGSDPDAGTLFSYTLAAETGNTDNSAFTISGNELKLVGIPDYETKATYNIRVRVSDGALTYDKQFTITITDVNDAPKNIALAKSSINENTPSGVTVTGITSIDEDSSSFIYTLADGSGSTDNASFLIAGNELKLAVKPDYELKADYHIRIRSTDDGGESFEKAFTITVNNLNETPTDITLSRSNIDENRAAGTVIGNLGTVDPDAGSMFTYHLVSGSGDTDNALFQISGNELKSAASFDYENKKSYSVRIRTTDAGGLSFEKEFTIAVNNIDESQPAIPQQPAATQPTPASEKPDNEEVKKVEKLTVDVAGGTDDSSVVKVETERTTASDGTIKDSITFEKATTEQIIEKLKQEKAEEIRILASDSKEKVSEVKLTIPQKSLELISDTELKLQLETTDARISIPNSSLTTAGEKMDKELFFTVKPVTDKEEKQELSARANKDAMLIRLMGNDISPIGNPVEIGTNMPKATVDVILPLTDISIPDDKKEREILQNKLAVYVEHSDGDKEILKGEIVQNSNGQYGLKFSVSKFSTFVIIKDERVKSDACKLLKLKAPEASVNGQLIESKVAYNTSKIKLQVTVSKGAAWKIYSNKACTKEIKNNLKLKLGMTKVYIKVTAQDGVNNEVYTLMINRSRK